MSANTEPNTRRVLHRVRSKQHPRYGQVCEKLIKNRAMSDVQVRFEDGTTEVVNSGILRVVRETEPWRQEK